MCGADKTIWLYYLVDLWHEDSFLFIHFIFYFYFLFRRRINAAAIQNSPIMSTRWFIFIFMSNRIQSFNVTNCLSNGMASNKTTANWLPLKGRDGVEPSTGFFFLLFVLFIFCQSYNFHDSGTVVGGDRSWSFCTVVFKSIQSPCCRHLLLCSVGRMTARKKNHKNFLHCLIFQLIARSVRPALMAVKDLAPLRSNARTRASMQPILQRLQSILWISSFIFPHNKILAIKFSSHYSISKYSIVCVACGWWWCESKGSYYNIHNIIHIDWDV